MALSARGLAKPQEQQQARLSWAASQMPCSAHILGFPADSWPLSPVLVPQDAPCHRTPLAHSSKAIGEPPFFLGASVFFALKVPADLAGIACRDSRHSA
jgi:hypothetical protein